jgi:hypothetical protein
MTTEVRYIIFTLEETRHAIVAFVLKQGYAGSANEIVAMKLSGGVKEALSVNVELRHPIANKPVNIAPEHLVGALLLYCNENRIPVPRSAQKRVEPSVGGLTLVLTTDQTLKAPVIVDNHITYAGIANYAQEANEAKQGMARAIERAESANLMTILATARAQVAETAAAESEARLKTITLAPGLRGWVARWLMHWITGGRATPAA